MKPAANKLVDVDADLAAFEQLPPQVRQMMHELTVSVTAVGILRFYRDQLGMSRKMVGPAQAEAHAVLWTCRRLVQIESGVLDQAGGWFDVIASVQRYGPREPRPRVVLRRRGLPPEVPEVAA